MAPVLAYAIHFGYSNLLSSVNWLRTVLFDQVSGRVGIDQMTHSRFFGKAAEYFALPTHGRPGFVSHVDANALPRSSPKIFPDNDPRLQYREKLPTDTHHRDAELDHIHASHPQFCCPFGMTAYSTVTIIGPFSTSAPTSPMTTGMRQWFQGLRSAR